MLQRHFDAHRPHRYVRYARMSTDMQNPRSPDQQFDNIDLTIRSCGYAWEHVKDYRDDATSGRLTTKRPQFQEMLGDLETGRVKADLILVDTFERFGRSDEAAAIRQRLHSRRVFLLTADSKFSDPTTPAGRALSFVEQFRATEDGRIKAHNVLRGKRDLASKGRWPGGPVPLGLRLKIVLIQRGGREEVDGNVLEPNPASRVVPARMFALSLEKGWGARKIARALNDDPTIPAEYKPISDSSVNICLKNTLYMGTLTYGKCRTGIENDRFVREPVEPGEEMVVEDFCEAIVSRKVFEAVATQRQARDRSRRGPGVAVGDDAAEAMPGARKYLLTGLVRCGDCGGAMDLSSTKPKNGPGRAYQYYRCRKQGSGLCANGAGVREELLRGLVVAKLRWRLFPPPEGANAPSWLTPLAEEVRKEIEARSGGDGDPRESLREELGRLEAQARSWALSLGKPTLPQATREVLEGELATNYERKRVATCELARLEATRGRLESIIDEGAVLDRLRRLDDVLAGENVGEANHELGRVIERVACHSDGRIELRTHRHGLFEGATQWMYPESIVKDGRKRTADLVQDDGRRFWTDPVEYAKPKRQGYPSWPRDHASEVIAKKREMGWNPRQLAEHFGKCRETIEKALEFATPPSPG